jgi:predicted RNA binding protein YcfA (HicA-like mRNA interferase family)
MARTPKPSGRLDRGPWDGPHIKRALERVGWREVYTRGSHVFLEHDNRAGRKVTIDLNWTGIKPGHDGFKSLIAETGYTKRELQKVLRR